MTVVRVKGFKIFVDRHGKPRCYHRASRKKIDLIACPLGSVEFFAACERITASNVPVAVRPGTFGHIVALYRRSLEFESLANRTRENYQAQLNIVSPLADVAFNQLDHSRVIRILDKAAIRGPATANALKAVLSVVFGWAAARGYIAANPVAGAKNYKRPRGKPDVNRPWTDAERHVVIDALPTHMRAAVAFMMFTGIGPGDALRLLRTAVKDNHVATQRSKTGQQVRWMVSPELRRHLDAAPPHEAITLFANSRGLPWSVSGFRASWRPIRKRLEASGAIGSGLTLYGLRHTMAVILRESGHSDTEIGDALGHTPQMARHYSKRADLTERMLRISENVEAEMNRRRTRIVKPGE
jgi:integrase